MARHDLSRNHAEGRPAKHAKHAKTKARRGSGYGVGWSPLGEEAATLPIRSGSNGFACLACLAGNSTAWIRLTRGHFPAQALDIEYPNFTPEAIKEFQLNGEAVDLNPNDDELLRLTGKTTSSVGSAFLKQPVSLGPDGSFKTFFEFMMNAPTTPGADGFAFTIQNDSRGAAAMGSGGGYLGYQDIRPSLSVEFDTFLNDTWDPKVEQHVAILVDGSVQNHLAWAEARGLNDGNRWFAWIEYDGVTKIMEVRFSSTGDDPKTPRSDIIWTFLTF